MRYLALATDYDGTIALREKVDEPTLAARRRFRASGRKLILVTGRELEELKTVFPHLDLFEWVVAENGALLYRPSNQEKVLLAEPPPERFVEELRARGVSPLAVGSVIVATWHPHEGTCLETIRDLGLELQVVFNKDAVMILPSNVNKATGLAVALEKLGLSPHNVVAVGDAENDLAMLRMCELSAAVDNALPSVKERADLTLVRDHGAGVTDLIDRILTDDLRDMDDRLHRHHLLLGQKTDGAEVRLPPYNNSILIAGPSGSGKSTVATGLLERLEKSGYQYCIIDPEGDYSGLEGAIVLGDAEHGPTIEEVMQVLRDPRRNVVVNMVGLNLADRPTFFVSLLTHLVGLRSSSNRPHWLIVDEAHHLLPASWLPAAIAVPQVLDRLLLITVHPKEVSQAVLSLVKTVIAVGPSPRDTVAEFCDALEFPLPGGLEVERSDNDVLVWSRVTGEIAVVKPAPSQIQRRRHIRKYAEGELPPERSFYFRGPENKLNLRAQNLILFMQLADGVDDETWTFHLRQRDVSSWFTKAIKDQELAAEALAIENDPGMTAADSRERIKAAIQSRYTLPASSFLPIPGTDAKPRMQQKPR